jgi:hypothetical protein
MGGHGPSFSNLVVGGQEAIHGSYGTQIVTLFQELGIDLRRSQINKTWFMQRCQHFLLFSL